MKRLVLLGAGHAHLHVLKAVGDALDPAISVTLVSPVDRVLYSGMVPGWVAGHYRLDECAIELPPLTRHARALVVRSAATLVNPAMREVICANGEIVPYDVLSIDVGSVPLAGGARGIPAHAVVVRPLERFVAGWEQVHARAVGEGLDAISIVGGGAAGIELAFAMDSRLRGELGARAPHVRVLTDTPAFLPGLPAAARGRLLQRARRRNIGLHAASPVAEVGPGYLRLRDGIEFATDATFWVAGPAPHDFLRASGLATDARGFLAVDAHLRSTSHPEVFGAGDCATRVGDPHAKAGVFAVRAGPALAANLAATLRGGATAAHRSPARHLALISCGDRHAVGVYGPLTFAGGWVWRWKDRIDRAFVARYAAASLAAR